METEATLERKSPFYIVVIHKCSDFQLHTLMLKFTNYWYYTINIKNSLSRSHKRILDDSDLELLSFRGCRTLFKLFPMPFTTYT